MHGFVWGLYVECVAVTTNARYMLVLDTMLRSVKREVCYAKDVDFLSFGPLCFLFIVR